MLALDTETTGLDWWSPDFRVFMCQWDDGCGDKGLCTEDTGWAALHAVLARHTHLVGANFAYDEHALRGAHGPHIDLSTTGHKLHDVQTLARVAVPGRFGYRLEQLGQDLLGDDSTEQQVALRAAAKLHGVKWTAEEKDYYGLWKLEPELMERYGMEDVDLTIRLWNLVWARASANDREVYKLEISGVSPILRQAERRGVRVNKSRLRVLKRTLVAERDELRAKLLAQGMTEEALGDDNVRRPRKGSNKALLVDLLAAGVPLYRKTPRSGALASNKDALREFEQNYPIVADLMSWRGRKQTLKTYVRPLSEAKPRVHTSFSQSEARTSRMCIAQGTFIEAPRNLLLHPHGIPIEDVQVGQYVYSHGDDGVPRPQRVLDKWSTGDKKVLKLVWRASGSKSYLGSLKATADHRVRLEDGSYRRMDELRPNDKLSYVGRSMNAEGRAYINWSGDRKTFEHQHLRPGAPVVHHDNGLKWDNRVENLVACADGAEHGRLHVGATQRGGRSKHLPCPYGVEQLSAMVRGGIRAAMREHGHDFNCWHRWALERGIEIPDMRRADPRNNHRVVMVMSEGETLPCWDLEIENTPCFVANEIGVHNSARRPNMQNLPVTKGIRDVLVPERGNAFVCADLDSIEVRVLAHGLKDAELTAQLDAGMDLHQRTAHKVALAKGEKCAFEDFAKGGPRDKDRTTAKVTTFTSMYGGGVKLLSVRLNVPYEEAAAIKADVLGSIPGYYDFDDRLKRTVQRRAFPHVVTILGRRLHTPRDKPYVALNTWVQGNAAELMKLCLVAAAPAAAEFGYRPLLVVHDEILLEGPRTCAPEALAATIAAMENSYPLSPVLKATGAWSADSYADAK